MSYRVIHNTTYLYAESAEACHNVARLYPRALPHQRSRGTEIHIDPKPASVFEYEDYFGNRVSSFAIYEPHFTLSITADSVVDQLPAAEVDVRESLKPGEVVRRLHGDRTADIVAALEFSFDSQYVRVSRPLRDYVTPFFPTHRPIGISALELTQEIFRDFKYDPKATTIDTSVEDVFEKRRGVCQDFAHLQIACLRSIGLACRYVSGYLRTDPAPGKARLQGADASHAWLSVFCPHTGWIDFDPTNGCRTDDRHVTIGWGRDFHDVSPVKGVVLGGGESTLQVAVDVIPLD